MKITINQNNETLIIDTEYTELDWVGHDCGQYINYDDMMLDIIEILAHHTK